ncbi:hypothetical protein E6C50_03830 [Flavobacterium supellecticarium]|uniref:DUF6591 domain-containing protein n=1 Tax=Flavobacterium supellecticarium TaxID=2565924 RepID=A0A4S4A4E9_9FLAO|nr:DUF6591 domain-containing protein [Flavobacterium supellecticarium]THF53342.1 hypothetical protein E6C50_03830 [Flavobacterium supellecticarium]
MNIKKSHLTLIAALAISLTSCKNNKTEEETSLDEVTTTYETPVSETDENTIEVAATSTDENATDAYLKSYEEFVDQYIILMEDAKSGDASAMTKYVEYMEKATDLSQKMEKSENEMTPAQMTKFLKIQAKLTQAISDMN